MANYANLLATIAANIYTNNNNEVTASMVKTAVDQMVASLGAGYQFMGVATPATNPGTPDAKVFYIAGAPGTYTNFGGAVVNEGEVVLLKGSGSSWSKEVTGAASRRELSNTHSEILSAPYVKSENELSSDATISDAYINNDGEFVSIGGGFYILRVPVEMGKAYTIYGNQHLASTYPWVGFSTQALTVGGKLDTILLREYYTSANHQIDFVFRPVLDGYLYIAVAYGRELKVYRADNVSGEVLNLAPLGELGNNFGYYNDAGTPTYPGSQNYVILVKATEPVKYPRFKVASSSALGFDVGVYRFDSGVSKYVLIHSQHHGSGTTEGVIDVPIKADDYVGIVGKSTTGGIGFTSGLTGMALTYLPGPTNDLASDFVESSITTLSDFAPWFKIYGLPADELLGLHDEEIAAQKEDLSYLFNEPGNRIGAVRITNFDSASLPSGWSNQGFTMTANGAASPAQSGVVDNLLQFSQYSDFDSSCVTFVLEATVAPQVIIARYGKQYPSDGANLIMFNFSTKKVIAYAPVAPGYTPTTILASFDIPFDFVAGRYVLSVSNFAEIQKYSIFGAGESVEFYLDTRKMATAPGRPHDNYGIIHWNGTYLVKQAVFSSQLAPDPDVLVVGDSIAEGDTIRTAADGGFENRWVGLLSKKTRVSLWAQGGNTSTNINNDLAFLVATFKPKKVIYAIGTNDNTYATWLSNAQAFVTAFEAIGAEVIFANSVLRPAYETAHAQIRAWIKASGHRYVDFCAAMSVDGECLNNKPGLFLPDGLHPNPAGHKVMYEALVASLPDLVNI